MSLKRSSTRSGTLMRSPRMSMSGGGAASPFLEGAQHRPTRARMQHRQASNDVENWQRYFGLNTLNVFVV